MLRRTSLAFGLLVLLFVLPTPAEKKPASASDLIELPVLLSQKVAAGITPVGTKVEAKLTISTLIHGTVVPRDAILSGEVTESEAKSAGTPSKLGIRVDSAKWKNGSLSLKVYLTEWYYPSAAVLGEDGNSGYSAIHGSVGVSVGQAGTSSSPFPPNSTGGDFPRSEPTVYPSGPDPNVNTSEVSPHRVRMKDVESKRSDDGAISLASKKSSLKLDKYTTYVLATGDLSAPN
jgi:hypothetical protein